MMDLIYEVRRTECFVQLGVFPANIEIKGYLLSMPNFEIFKGGPEEEGKVSTKKPKAGYYSPQPQQCSLSLLQY